MRFKTFLENVLDASEKFKKKQVDNFEKRVNGVALNLPNTFFKQDQQEAHVNNEIVKLKNHANTKMRKYRLMLAPILKEYPKDHSILDLFGAFEDPDFLSSVGFKYEDREIMLDFVRAHGQDVELIIDELIKGLGDIKKWSDEQYWSSGDDSLNRYTNFGQAWSEARMSKTALERLMRDAN